MENLTHSILGLNPSLFAILIVSIAYIFIFTEKVNRAIVVLLAAGVLIIANVMSLDEAIKGVDFNTIALLIGMMIIVSISEKSGIFQFVAIFFAKKLNGNPRKLLAAMAIITAVFSAFLDNVTTVLLLVPITFQITKKLEVSPYPYLLIEIFSSNLGGTATLIGDPPNILIGSKVGISFMDFLINQGDIVVVCMILLILAFDLVYGRKLTTTQANIDQIMLMDENKCIEDKSLLQKSLFVLFSVILGFIFAEKIEIANGVISLFGASVLMLLYTFGMEHKSREDRVENLLGKVDWITIFFFTGLFVMVHSLKITGTLDYLGQELLKFTHGNIEVLSYSILFSSAFFSSIIDNIPFVATMIPLIQSIQGSFDYGNSMYVWEALSLGSCFGGNGTLIGASANVVVAGLAMKYGCHIGFFRFMRWSIPVMLMSIAVSAFWFYMGWI